MRRLMMLLIVLFCVASNSAIADNCSSKGKRYISSWDEGLGWCVGQKGPMKKVLLDGQGSPVEDFAYHDLWKDDSLGFIIGERGMRKYLIDSESGKRVSRDGYNEIWKDDSLGHIVAEFEGELFLVDPESGKRVSDGYHEIRKKDSLGYIVAELVGEQFILDENGNILVSGYHTYTKRNGEIYGSFGPMKELVIDIDGNVIGAEEHSEKGSSDDQI